MTCYEPLIRASFECLRFELGRLATGWRTGAPVSTIRSVARAAEQFTAAVFERVKLAPFEALAGEATGLVHDAYIRVLALAQLLDEAGDERWAEPGDLAFSRQCAVDLLDALAPCVSPADRALREVALGGIELDGGSRRDGPLYAS